MTHDQWLDKKARIQELFSVVYEGVEKLPDTPGSMDVIEFEAEKKSFRCEFVTKPKTLGRKVIAAARIGASAHESAVYSSDETVNYLRIFRWNERADDWEEVRSDNFAEFL